MQEQFSKYDYGQSSESRFVYIHITNISDIMLTNNYIIIQYTNYYYRCMMFLIFSTPIDIAHLVTSIVKKPFSCLICHCFSLDKHKMKLHTTTYHDDKTYYCANHAKIKQNLNIMYICEMPSLCSICDKNFSINKSIHIYAYPIPNALNKPHTGKKPHYHVLCELIMTHSGIKFHLWETYITATHINLNCHMTTHTGEKPRRCPQCHTIPLCLIKSPQMPKTMHTEGDSLACMRFVMLSCIIINPTNHMGFHSKERPYQCSYCDRTLPKTNILMPSFF